MVGSKWSRKNYTAELVKLYAPSRMRHRRRPKDSPLQLVPSWRISTPTPTRPAPLVVDNIQPQETALEELDHIEADPAASWPCSTTAAKAAHHPARRFAVLRLPGYRRWIGTTASAARWLSLAAGTEALPPTCLHTATPSCRSRGRGYATRALAMPSCRRRKEGLVYVGSLPMETCRRRRSSPTAACWWRFNKARSTATSAALLFRIALS